MIALYVKALAKSILAYVVEQRLLMAYAKTWTAYKIVKSRTKNAMNVMGKENSTYENAIR